MGDIYLYSAEDFDRRDKLLNLISITIGDSLSSLANVSSSNVPDLNNIELKTYFIEYGYNAPKLEKTPSDHYVETTYRMDADLTKRYAMAEYGFMDVVQKFALNQIELDAEFNAALDKLFISKINSRPTKKRF